MAIANIIEPMTAIMIGVIDIDALVDAARVVDVRANVLVDDDDDDVVVSLATVAGFDVKGWRVVVIDDCE